MGYNLVEDVLYFCLKKEKSNRIDLIYFNHRTTFWFYNTVLSLIKRKEWLNTQNQDIFLNDIFTKN